MTHVTYEPREGFAVIRLDDGKANVLSPGVLADLDAALDRAEEERAVVLLAGRDGIFSGGFDLGVLRGADEQARAMLNAGFTLAERLLGFPRPVVAACTGHAIAMAAFLLMSCDYRLGAAGPYRLTANEVAIGLTLPRAAVEICRQRLTPPYLHRVVALADVLGPEQAVAAGILDEVVEPDRLEHAAEEAARRMVALDAHAHIGTKLRARAATLTTLRTAIVDDDAEMAALLTGATP